MTQALDYKVGNFVDMFGQRELVINVNDREVRTISRGPGSGEITCLNYSLEDHVVRLDLEREDSIISIKKGHKMYDEYDKMLEEAKR